MSADSTLVAELCDLIGAQHVRTDPVDTARHTIPFRGSAGTAAAVALPATADEASAIVELAIRHHVRVLPQGANTGLVGASVPDASGTWLVVCTDRLNTIEFSPSGDIAVCGAGVRLSALNDALAPLGRWLPIDVGGDPSIGGMVSTNAGGARMVRYGNTASRTIDVEGIVTAPDPARTTFGPLVHKNAVPRPARDLLVGGNGQFGLITAVAVATAPIRPLVQTAWAVVDTAQDAQRIVTKLLGSGLQVDAAETMAETCIDAVRSAHPQLRIPAHTGAYHLLLEFSMPLAATTSPTNPAAHASTGTAALTGRPAHTVTGIADQLAASIAHLVDSAAPGATLLAIEPGQAWAIRHSISDAIRHRGTVVGCDIGLPQAQLADFVDEVRAWLATHAPHSIFCDFGHWADGGVHANVVINDADSARHNAVDPSMIREAINTFAAERGGTFSAEHGIGPSNATAWRRWASATDQKMFGRLKQVFDPHGLWGWPLDPRN